MALWKETRRSPGEHRFIPEPISTEGVSQSPCMSWSAPVPGRSPREHQARARTASRDLAQLSFCLACCLALHSEWQGTHLRWQINRGCGRLEKSLQVSAHGGGARPSFSFRPAGTGQWPNGGCRSASSIVPKCHLSGKHSPMGMLAGDQRAQPPPTTTTTTSSGMQGMSKKIGVFQATGAC